MAIDAAVDLRHDARGADGACASCTAASAACWSASRTRVFARTRTPDRVFGMLLVVQYGLGGLGIMLLPRLVPVYGHGVLFGALIAFSFVTLLMLPFLDAYPRGPHRAAGGERRHPQGTARGDGRVGIPVPGGQHGARRRT